MDSKTRWAARIFDEIKKNKKTKIKKMVPQEDLHSQHFTPLTVIFNQELLGNDVISMMVSSHTSFELWFFLERRHFCLLCDRILPKQKDFIFLLFILC